GVGIDAVRGEIEAIAARLAESYPEANRGIGVEVVPFRDFYVARGRTLFLLLQGAVLFVLLIACTNVANLILARGAAREGELAVRTAIGAGRFQIVRQLLSESLTLAIAGGALGLLLAHWGIGILVRAIPVDLPFWIRVGIDGRVVAFVIILSIATGFLFGLLPALRNSRVDLTSSLKEGGRKGAGLRRRRLFKSTVVAEVALTIILLICAGLMIESFLRLQRVDPGLEPEGVLTARVSDLPEASYPEDHQVVSFYSRLTEELEVVPGVEAVGADSRLPLRGQAGSERIFNVEDRPELAAGESLPFANFQVVTPGYFRTLGVPVLEGRAFEEQDDATGRPVAIVNRKLAEQIWPGERAVGKRIRFGTTADQQPWMTVVGVAGDVRHRGLDQELMLDLYVPLRQYPVRSMTLVMRTAFQPDDVAPAIREAVLRLDPELPIYDVMSMDQVVSESLWLQRFSAYLLLVLGGVALVLAAVGLYGVVAYFVTERVHEIGIRMSLGASRSTVIRLVLRQSLILVLAGVVLGLPLAALLNRGLASVLYGVGALELVPIVGISVLLVVVAVVAAFLPARRATRVDPAVSLRYQ
ncbi:MAG TPA: ADOP family duplicated permease, partial [Thermoanaerobaculia bacterium]|nr:ADOP family duplicated permease [Thermoanaerobaculia bacterium]